MPRARAWCSACSAATGVVDSALVRSDTPGIFTVARAVRRKCRIALEYHVSQTCNSRGDAGKVSRGMSRATAGMRVAGGSAALPPFVTE